MTGEKKLVVLRALSGRPWTTEAELRRALAVEVPPSTVRAALIRAVDSLVERSDGPPAMYRLTEAGERWLKARLVELGEMDAVEVKDGSEG